MKIAIVAAGFTPGEADRLRRAMATFKRVGTISTFFNKMVDGMVANGYKRDFAERCFKADRGLSAPMAFRKAMRPHSRCSSMSRPG